MLKIVAFIACTLLIVAAFPESDDRTTTERHFVPIIKSEINKHDDGSYDLHYESGDGSQRQEQASIVDAGTEDEALEIKGSYKYINADGEEVEVFYTAGVNGFVPYGSTINSEISAVAEAAKNLPKENDDKYDVKGKKIIQNNN